MIPPRFTLSADFTKTLAEGEHTITIVSTDGQVSSKFTVVKADNPNNGNDQPGGNNNQPGSDKPNGNNTKPGTNKPSAQNPLGKLLPKTGDYATVAVPFIVVAAVVVVGVAYYLKKKGGKK